MSPGLQAKLVSAGTRNSSFKNAQQDVRDLMDLEVCTKQIERLTERIGAARGAERDAEVKRYMSLPLTERKAKPTTMTESEVPKVAVVGVDGGRLQILDRQAKPGASGRNQANARRTDQAEMGPGPNAQPTSSEDTAEVEQSLPPDDKHRGTHWREDKIGVLMTMTSAVSEADPCPQVPAVFVDPRRIVKLTRELKTKKSAAEEAAKQEAVKSSDHPEMGEETLHHAGSSAKWQPPEVEKRHLAATRRPWAQFGPIMATMAWTLGFYQAARRAFLGDGSENNWTMWRQHFSSFVPILDIIHAISYLFAAAMAGRPFAQGWGMYKRWMAWLWQGEVEQVIAELAQRQVELGAPQESDGETHPRKVVATALGYFQNHQDKMRYADYRRQGLPITSSYVESAVKQFNQRVKGTEKFWTEAGAEALLQLRADQLDDAAPMADFWQRRQANEAGLRNYATAA